MLKINKSICWNNCRNVCCFVFVAKDTCAGNTCETLIICLSHTCQNGESCVETNNEQTPYNCDCGKGYHESNCEGLFITNIIVSLFSKGNHKHNSKF